MTLKGTFKPVCQKGERGKRARKSTIIRKLKKSTKTKQLKKSNKIRQSRQSKQTKQASIFSRQGFDRNYSKRRFAFKVMLILLLVFCFATPLVFAGGQAVVYADTTSEREEALKQLEDSVLKQLDTLDLKQLDEILKSLGEDTSNLFGADSFKEKIINLVNGKFSEGKQSFWEALVGFVFDDLLQFLPLMATVIAIAVSSGMLQGLRPTNNSKSIQDVIHFVTYGIVVVIILEMTMKMVTMTGGVITTIKSQMDAIFPILLTLLTALGGSTSVSVYQPAMAMLTGSILNVFTYILLPLFIFSVVFSVVSNLSNTVKLDKFTSFFNSTFKWITGLIFTIFSAFLSIQGITAGSVDGISIRTARYAIRSYVPILGSYLSDGLSVVLASSSLIKNAVGAAGLLMLISTIISPLLQLVVFMLCLKLVAAILEPLGNAKVANFVSSISKSMVLLIVLIIGVAFIYFIVLGLIMCSANFF